MYTLQLLPDDTSSPYYTTLKGSDQNAGFDLFVPADVTFLPNEKKLVSMNVKAVMLRSNETVHYWMLPRSSISKTGLMLCNSVGVIDRSYRGELMAYLWNTTDKPVIVSKGSRLVQIVPPDMGHLSYIQIVSELDHTSRGSGGFGSSGI